jgi:glutaredoxin-like protein NrdH
MGVLKVYTKDHCPGCQQVKRMFNYLQVAYEECRVDENPVYYDWVVARGFRSLPVVEVEGLGAVPGSNQTLVEQLLVQANLV